METNSHGNGFFPLVTASSDGTFWTCVGSGVYINPTGWFVTAKHIFEKNVGSLIPTHYGIHTFEDGRSALRVAKNSTYSPP